jgi:hypothetical protein
MKIGEGYFYNNYLGKSWVSELDTDMNTCISQIVDIQIYCSDMNKMT